MNELPLAVNDGTFDYRLIRQEEQLPDGRANIALYERVPVDPAYQFTPHLEFVQAARKGESVTPIMLRIKR